MRDLVNDGNSVLLVDHDVQILSDADWLIEMGPQAGANGGRIIAEGSINDIEKNKNSLIGPFLSDKRKRNFVNGRLQKRCSPADPSAFPPDRYIRSSR